MTVDDLFVGFDGFVYGAIALQKCSKARKRGRIIGLFTQVILKLSACGTTWAAGTNCQNSKPSAGLIDTGSALFCVDNLLECGTCRVLLPKHVIDHADM